MPTTVFGDFPVKDFLIISLGAIFGANARYFVSRYAAKILGPPDLHQGEGSPGESQGAVAENLTACPAIGFW